MEPRARAWALQNPLIYSPAYSSQTTFLEREFHRLAVGCWQTEESVPSHSVLSEKRRSTALLGRGSHCLGTAGHSTKFLVTGSDDPCWASRRAICLCSCSVHNWPAPALASKQPHSSVLVHTTYLEGRKLSIPHKFPEMNCILSM